MSFNIAITGIHAATTDLNAISNNIANANTVGFKSSRVEFADLYATQGGVASNAVGGGVQVASVNRLFSQGPINSTGNPLDLAINGEGFFRLNDDGSIVYTRAGIFGLDAEGFIVNSKGQRLTGFQADASGQIGNVLGDLSIPVDDMSPSPTGDVQAALNLDATAAQPAVTPFDAADPQSYNYSTAVTLYDSLGVAHTMTLYFVKTANANEWELHATVDGTAEANVTLSANTLTFQDDGTLDTTASTQPITVDVDLNAVATELGLVNGATTPLTFDLDFTGTTQFGAPFSTNALSQDGFTSGSLAGVDIDEQGIILGRYTNGQSKVLGQVALANFRNPQGLVSLGNNEWAENAASGQPVVGVPGSGTLGVIQAGALEGSNVDLTEQLVNMITAQRNFQASAKVITTEDALTQTALNISR